MVLSPLQEYVDAMYYKTELVEYFIFGKILLKQKTAEELCFGGLAICPSVRI